MRPGMSVKSIRVRDHQASIISEDCLLCGRCVQVCPQNAKDVRDDVPLVKQLIASGEKVIATLAPSFIAAFDAKGFRPMADAMKKLAFTRSSRRRSAPISSKPSTKS